MDWPGSQADQKASDTARIPIMGAKKGPGSGLTTNENPLMMIKVVSGLRRSAEAHIVRSQDELVRSRFRAHLHMLPPRSMVGQLPLEQPIGVRIPGGQPI